MTEHSKEATEAYPDGQGVLSEAAVDLQRTAFDRGRASVLPVGAPKGAHIECDCVPNLGPSHCHACGEIAGHPVPWSETIHAPVGAPDTTEDERGDLSNFLFSIFNMGTLPNALREADAILGFLAARRSLSPVVPSGDVAER